MGVERAFGETETEKIYTVLLLVKVVYCTEMHSKVFLAINTGNVHGYFKHSISKGLYLISHMLQRNEAEATFLTEMFLSFPNNS